MNKLIILSILSLVSIGAFGQLFNNKTDFPVYDCVGAVNIFNNGDFTLQFTGEKSQTELNAYHSLGEFNSHNNLWVSYIAAESGVINFKATTSNGYLQMAIFNQLENSICEEIITGISEIERVITSKEFSEIGLNKNINTSQMYPVRLETGQKINILFSTNEKSKEKLSLKWDFVADDITESKTKSLDRRTDDFAPTFSITIRDITTNHPLIANISIDETRNLNGLYHASDLFLNIERRCDMKIKCDVEGYFFKDSIVAANSFGDQEITFFLQKISSGLSIKIENIEFKPGSSEITSSSEPKLNRLKDFLLLNSDICVEIQGHVFAVGDNSFAGEKLSEARAKRVRKHLIEHGIDKNRLRAKGFGNSKPIFEEPKFSYEEQANRRVEILVL